VGVDLSELKTILPAGTVGQFIFPAVCGGLQRVWFMASRNSRTLDGLYCRSHSQAAWACLCTYKRGRPNPETQQERLCRCVDGYLLYVNLLHLGMYQLR
jgi:hypothetical protein